MRSFRRTAISIPIATLLALATLATRTSQRDLLEREGVRFDARGRVELAAFGWRPRR